MPQSIDGPKSKHFKALTLKGNTSFSALAKNNSLSSFAKKHVKYAPTGKSVGFGIEFNITRPLLVENKTIDIPVKSLKANWLVFMHTTDLDQEKKNKKGFVKGTAGKGLLNQHVADYIFTYTDGTQVTQDIRRRHHVSMMCRDWGDNCFQAVTHAKPRAGASINEQLEGNIYGEWGRSQTKSDSNDFMPWVNWLYAWENPHPSKMLKSISIVPKNGKLIISALSAGKVKEHPLRWNRREKALLKLPKGTNFNYTFDLKGQYDNIKLDMGSIIRAEPKLIYPEKNWPNTRMHLPPVESADEVLVEYTAHPEATFHFANGKTLSHNHLTKSKAKQGIKSIEPAHQRVTLKVVNSKTKQKEAVKLHIHGANGEYLPPVDRHRNANYTWFENYAPEMGQETIHRCTYIDGETIIDLPLGKVYIEISKGFEMKPVRKIINVTKGTKQITIPLTRVLHWRQEGWVTADTHVHFLSPSTAQLEGAAEDVNVINLLSSQWGELMSNAGDFDGKSTYGTKEAGGTGEHLVRVGTENRQHVLGHISLIGYSGSMISPMCTSGPDEAALGDPVDALLTTWARQCRDKGGLVIMPHLPQPRCENAATIINGLIDGVEMTSWQHRYNGIDPYSLSDWYRYLNCGIFVPVVGGTDKMSAITAVGNIRTYVKLPKNKAFTFNNWMEAVKKGNTFASFGPLIEMKVDGKVPGQTIKMSQNGGTVDIEWNCASVDLPMTQIELVVNGEIVSGKKISATKAKGHFKAKIEKSSWVALLIRGKYKDKPKDMIAAHTSPVMIEVKKKPYSASADAVTILEQIEGALAYIDTIGTRAEMSVYKQLKMDLKAAWNKWHKRMHEMGVYHQHSPVHDHKEHHHHH